MNWLRRDLPLKLVSVLIALGLFVWVRGEQETDLSVPVAIQYKVPQGFTTVEPTTQEVSLRIRGSRLALTGMDRRGLPPLKIDPARAQGGKVKLEAKMFPLPEGLRVTYISPAVLDLRIEKVTQRTVPVRVRLGKNEAGLLSRATPATVTVSGATSAVNAVREIATREVPAKVGAHKARFSSPAGIKVKPSRVQVEVFTAAARP